MTSIMQYNVVVDIHCSKYDLEDIFEQFANAIHVEEIGQNQFQVGLGVFAPNGGEAYRRGVNAVEAEMLCLDSDPAILGAEVYAEDLDDPLVFD